jgi:hypothetical protein
MKSNTAAFYADDMFSLGSDTSGDEDDSGNGVKDKNNEEKKHCIRIER